MTQQEKENVGYTIETPKKGSKIINFIAPVILLASFIIGVGYTSLNLMAKKNDNYLEKVEQMKKANGTDTETKKEVSEEANVLIDETT